MGTFQRGRHAISFILLLLTDGPAYGLELLEKIDEIIPGNNMDRAILYKNLANLEKDGCVTVSLDDSRKGAVRKYYSITNKGLSALSECAEEIRFRVGNLNIFLKKYDSINIEENR